MQLNLSLDAFVVRARASRVDYAVNVQQSAAMSALETPISAIKALAAARQRALVSSHQVEDVVRACISHIQVTGQAQCLYAIASFDSLAALKVVFALEPSERVSHVLLGLDDLELHYSDLFSKSDPQSVVEPLNVLFAALDAASLTTDPHGYIVKLEQLHAAIVDASRQVLDGSTVPVSRDTFQLVEDSFMEMIASIPSRPSSQIRDALSALSSAFDKASEAQIQMEREKSMLLKLAYNGDRRA